MAGKMRYALPMVVEAVSAEGERDARPAVVGPIGIGPVVAVGRGVIIVIRIRWSVVRTVIGAWCAVDHDATVMMAGRIISVVPVIIACFGGSCEGDAASSCSPPSGNKTMQ